MAKIYPDTMYTYEGAFFSILIVADYRISKVEAFTGLSTEKISDYVWKVEGFVGVTSRDEPYYITVYKSPLELSEEVEDFNIKVYVKKCDIDYDWILNNYCGG
jgi:hypothetical protein